MKAVGAAARRLVTCATAIAALALISSLPDCRTARPPLEGGPAPAGTTKPAPEPPKVKEVVPEEGGEGTFALEEPFTSLAAPHLATLSDRTLRGLAFHGLTRFNDAGRVEAELAVKWEMLHEGSEWVFHLRPETVFTNGRYLEARHVAASWEKLILAPDSFNAWLLETVKGYDEMRSGKAPHLAGLILEDGLTLRVKLSYPVRNFPARLAHPAMGISAFGEDEEGIGYFQIWGTPKSQLVVLRSNPEYFRGLPHLDEMAFVRGEAAARERMATGALDIAVLPPLDKAPSESLVRVFTLSEGRTYLLGLNRGAPPFTRDDTVSRFLASLDREEMARAAAGESGRVPATLLGGQPPHRQDSSQSVPGAPPPGLGRLDLVYPEGDRTLSLLVEQLTNRVLKAGGRVVPHSVRAADIPGTLARREYQLFIVPSLPSSPDPLLRLEEMIRWNRSAPAAVLTAVRELEEEGNPSKIAAGLSSLDASLRQEGLLFPLAQVPRRFLVGKGMCGLHPDPMTALEWARIWRSRHPRGECD
ncbi:MAG: ABC transporter substrate-binding protein [Acidobacteria bacterium]|nr:ABC transporter substrate-binding protein [Acidobacteriota bacterium]